MATIGGQVVFAKQNKTAPRALAFIEKNPHCSTTAIQQALGVSMRTLQRTLLMLQKRELIHVADYDYRLHGSGKPARLFIAGPGANEKPHKPTKTQTRRRRIQWQQKRRSELSVHRRAQAGGVFGVLIAQVVV